LENKIVKPHKLPLVSVICTSYNHEHFLLQSLNSILEQEYGNLEIILVDNGSNDKSQELMELWYERNKGKLPLQIILRNTAINYCESFNEAFQQCRGKYLVDFSTDDKLMPKHIRFSVDVLENAPDAAAVFSDAWIIDKGKSKSFYKRKRKGELAEEVESGWIYEKVVAYHHILSPTMLMRSKVFEDLGMYDQDLAYEDFDIIVRMARKYRLCFSDHFGVEKMIHSMAFSKEQYKVRKSRLLPSTLKICQKIIEINRCVSENHALLKRVHYEWRQSLLSANFEVADGFLALAQKLHDQSVQFQLFRVWTRRRVDVSKLAIFLGWLQN
jgi:glycosyltransferase involved in cell wall biosynthesis